MPPTDRRFDARAHWAALDPEQQQRLGEAALLLSAAVLGQANAVERSQVIERWEHAEAEAWQMIAAFDPDLEMFPDGPDLEALGIRTCRECGCTDANACDEGCSWLEDDLCSACATEGLEPDA
jgi:hypothetical protein